MAFRIPRFDRSIPVVESNRTPTLPFHIWWDKAAKAIEDAINGIQDALIAAGIALNAAEDAQAAADTAQAAADAAQAAAEGAGTVSKLSGSGTDGLTVTATDAGTDVTINISAHTRLYSDGTSVSVDAGSLTGRNYATTYYLYYDDPTYAGGAVTYQSTVTQSTAAQVNGRHLVGEVTTPAAGQPDEGGQVPGVPGFGDLR